ncbi:hypothetical protein ACFE04_023513 [Oxalis oulophora]
MEFHFPSISFLFGFVMFVLMVIKIHKSNKSTSSVLLPPGPRRLPVIGNLHVLIGCSLMHHRLRELSMKYGPLMHLKLGEVSCMVISSDEVAKQVMKTYDLNFCHRPKTITAGIITYNFTDILYAPYGNYWKQLRRVCMSELLGPKHVKSFGQIREDLVSDFIKSISDSYQAEGSSTINLSKMIFSLTYQVTSRVAFGMECEDLESFISIVEQVLAVMAGFNIADFFPSVKLLHSISGISSKLKRLHQGLDKVLQNIIDKHMARRAMHRAGEDHEREDIVDVLLNLREHGNLELPLTIDNMKSVIMDLFIAGSDTSSTIVEWAVSELLKNPKVMKKAQEEVRHVFKSQENLSESGIDQLEYLKLVIKEILRLHPPVFLIPREGKERCEINGYEIPAMSKIIVNVWAIGRDPRKWTKPESFWPERFMDSLVDFKGVHFEFIPFGAGRRICPGMSFGLAHVELLLAQLLYHFDWNLPTGTSHENLDMTEKFGLVVGRKRDLYVVPVPHHPPTV